MGDFTLTQAALLVDALARSEVKGAKEVLKSFVLHWMAVDSMHLAQPEDVAHLANAAVKLQLEATDQELAVLDGNLQVLASSSSLL